MFAQQLLYVVREYIKPPFWVYIYSVVFSSTRSSDSWALTTAKTCLSPSIFCDLFIHEVYIWLFNWNNATSIVRPIIMIVVLCTSNKQGIMGWKLLIYFPLWPRSSVTINKCGKHTWQNIVEYYNTMMFITKSILTLFIKPLDFGVWYSW